MQRKNSGKFARMIKAVAVALFRPHLSQRAFSLLCLCLAIHITYDSALLFALRKNLIERSTLARDFSTLCEAHVLAFLFTAIGVALLELEVRRHLKK